MYNLIYRGRVPISTFYSDQTINDWKIYEVCFEVMTRMGVVGKEEDYLDKASEIFFFNESFRYIYTDEYFNTWNKQVVLNEPSEYINELVAKQTPRLNELALFVKLLVEQFNSKFLRKTLTIWLDPRISNLFRRLNFI